MLFQLWVRWQLDSAFSQEPDVSGTSPVQTWTIDQKVGAIAFSPDGQLVAVGTSIGKIELRHVSDGRILRTLQTHPSRVKVLAFTPDGRLLASGNGDDWQADEWPTRDKQGAQVNLWQVADGKLLHTWDGYIEDTSDPDPYSVEAVNAIAFSSDGQTITWGGTDGLVQARRVADGQYIGSLPASTGSYINGTRYIVALTLSGDGRTLTSGNVEDMVQKWLLLERRLVLN